MFIILENLKTKIRSHYRQQRHLLNSLDNSNLYCYHPNKQINKYVLDKLYIPYIAKQRKIEKKKENEVD